MAYFGEESTSAIEDKDQTTRNDRSDLGNLPMERESSALLIEETEEVNIVEGEVVHNIHLAKSLSKEEKDRFIHF